MIRELRRVAMQVRTQHSQPFYPLREAAAFFGVAVSLVSLAYKQLEAEGLLIRKRGAMTVLAPVRPRSLMPTRGVVAIPFWIPGFLMHRDWRQFIVHLEEEIRRHGFVASLIFYGAKDEMYPAFSYRVLEHKPDALIWFLPTRAHIPVVEMVAEAGVQVLTIHNNADSSFRGGKCVIDYWASWRVALAQWRAAGIRRAVLPRHSPEQSAHITTSMEHFLRQNKFPYSLTDANGSDLTHFVTQLPCQSDTVIAFIDDLFFITLCAQAPVALVNLLRSARSFILHPINLPPDYLQGVRVDAPAFDFKHIAEIIAYHLHTGRAFAATKPLIIQAQVKMQVDAAELARHFGVT